MIKHLSLSFLLLSLAISTAHAEKADSQQPLHISAESQTYDGNKKVTVYTGSVHMVKGTLIINAARLEVVEDANGGKIGTLFSGPGKLVNYRQKRDGGPDLWAEGEADKVVYDDTLELIKLFNQAKLVLLDGKKRTHESSGIYISYDSRTDFMSVNNTLQGISAPGAGFTNAVIYPVEDKPKAAPVKVEPKVETKVDSKTEPKPATKPEVTHE
ncbi:lipopolysaccharide transport periplasmic protein LptA [Solimicrobium silvestre]|uniref:Lipopolysaccharide export system protein LptA n=1 Tax=Solimicrobium silvestre TaxID=2099400 RepID=A0A2S9H4C9_9BURK|nr:lipopolysaccharide transport periplasmic protein LptA [Solimicrobium silvestre]PRC94793.1 Lipopolysaccharide transport periplasmic protein LptA [Solimicrobium silvestre]